MVSQRARETAVTRARQDEGKAPGGQVHLSETRKAQRNNLTSIEQGVIPPGAKGRIAELSRAEEDAMRRIDALTTDTDAFDVAAFEEWLKEVVERGSDELVVEAFASRVVFYGGYGIVGSEHKKNPSRLFLPSTGSNNFEMAPRVGFEPTTLRLTAGCSAVELPRNLPIICALSERAR